MKEILITSSVLILAVVAIRFAFRKTISRRVQYALWGLVLLRLLLPFHLPALAHNVLSTAADTPAMETARELGDTAVLWRDYEIPQSAPAEPDPKLPREERQAQYRENIAEWEAEQREWREATGTPVTVGDILRYVWYGGMAVMTLWLLVTNLRFYRKIRKARLPYEADDCKYPVYLCDGLPSPCLFGVFRPAIYLTPAATETPDRLRFVLAHEQTHARHLDPLWSLLRGVCLVVYWFDPLVWLAAYLSKLDCELACDEGMLSRLPPEERVAYGETLLSLIPVRRGGDDPMLSATTMTAGKRQMRDRITRIAENRRLPVIALFAALALTLGVCAATFTGAAAPAEPSEPGDMERLVSASEEQGNIILQTNADLDHDGVDERVVLYEITAEETPRAYVVCVYKNGEPLWAEAYDLSHPGWGKLYLCRADGQDWLVRYLPTMYQGYATYTWTQFSLENAQEKEERGEGVDFNLEDPSSIRNGTLDAFSTRLNAVLADSTLLISTVDGTARWGAANEANVDVYGELEMPLPFRGLWGLEGYGWYEDVEVAPHHYTRGYYAYDAAGEPVQLAESFGFNLEDFILDLDGDGVTELICNCVYGADGGARVNVYRRSGDLIERGTFDPVTLGLTDWDTLGGVGSHGEYWDAEAGAFTTEYLTGSGEWRTVRRPDYAGFTWERYAILGDGAWDMTLGGYLAALARAERVYYVPPIFSSVAYPDAIVDDDLLGSLRETLTRFEAPEEAYTLPYPITDDYGVRFDDSDVTYRAVAGHLFACRDATGEAALIGRSFQTQSFGLVGWFAAEQRSRSAEPLDVVDAMRRVTADDLRGSETLYNFNGNVTAEALAAALNDAAERETDGAARAAAGYLEGVYGFWSIEDAYLEGGPNVWSSNDRHFWIECGLTENLVEVTLSKDHNSDTAYFDAPALYRLVRHAGDYPEVIDAAAWAELRGVLEPYMAGTAARMNGAAPQYTGYEPTRLEHVYAWEDGDTTDGLYRFRFALLPENPLTVGWAGGMYLDSKGRVQGFNADGLLAVRRRSGVVTAVSTSFFGSDIGFWPEDYEGGELRDYLERWRADIAAALDRAEVQ